MQCPSNALNPGFSASREPAWPAEAQIGIGNVTTRTSVISVTLVTTVTTEHGGIRLSG